VTTIINSRLITGTNQLPIRQKPTQTPKHSTDYGTQLPLLLK